MRFNKMHKNTLMRSKDPTAGSSQSTVRPANKKSVTTGTTSAASALTPPPTPTSTPAPTPTPSITSASTSQDDPIPSPKQSRRVSFSDSGNNEIILDSDSDSSLIRFEDELMDFLEGPSRSPVVFHSNYKRRSSASTTTQEPKIRQEPNRSFKTRKSSPGETTYFAPDKRMVVALWDFRPRTNDDLGFSKGDCLEIIKSTYSDWWLACSEAGNIGYIPSNFVAEVENVETEPWFFGDITRTEAHILLTTPPNCHGSFLIRVSETRHMEYSLSVRSEDIVNHYRIKYSDIGWFYISHQKHFPTLKKLVEYYSQNLSGMCCRLGKPCRQVRELEPDDLSYCKLDTWEIRREQIELTDKLAIGNFGEVYKGVWNKTTPIAVKTLKKGTTTELEFLAEAQVMKKLRHPKLIQLYGICSDCEPFYIVTEFMKYGSLNKYLKDYSYSISLKDRLSISSQVASGMAYLESQSFIHRDLAARNVLVGNGLTCKIADFGLSRILQENEYLAHSGTRFPVKWTAPEALFYNTFSIKSDVWSYGILLVEVFTNGDFPYPDLSNQQVVKKISTGYRMSRPEHCPIEIYTLMLKCWDVDPHLRPSFKTLRQTMESFCLVLHKKIK